MLYLASTLYELIAAVFGVGISIVLLITLTKKVLEERKWIIAEKVAKEAMTWVEDYSKDHPGMTSKEKLEMALDTIKSDLAIMEIELDEEFKNKIIDYIRDMCEWSKTVNN